MFYSVRESYFEEPMPNWVFVCISPRLWLCCFLWISVIYYNKYTRIAIIRVKRGLHNMLMQTMALISQIKSTDVSFRAVHIAGMINTANKRCF